MIRVARLKEYNKRAGHLMKSYTSYTSQTKYVVGKMGLPSPLRIVPDPREIDELRGIPQFEILEFETEEDLREMIQTEMEVRARLGAPPARAEIVGAINKIVKKVEEKRAEEKSMAKAKRVLSPLSFADAGGKEETGDETGDEIPASDETPASVEKDETPKEIMPPSKKKKAPGKKKASKKRSFKK